MLVLSRHRDERIKIGDDIEICICDIRGDKVRIGIEAPRDVRVIRTELLTRGPNDDSKHDVGSGRVGSFGRVPGRPGVGDL